MTFEWDSNKNKANQKKHDGISFEIAVRVFLDNKRIELYDAAHSQDEERWNVLGQVEDVLFVVYTNKDDEIYRIISARKATKEEQNEYFNNYDAR